MTQGSKYTSFLVLKLTLFSHLFAATSGQCRGTETFEKLSRVTLEGVESAPPLFTYSGGTVTAGCLDRCREARTCSGFVVDYSREACFPLSPVYPPAGPNPTPRPADHAVNYFQKICLNGPTCGKAWMLERVVGFEIEGYDDLVLNDVATRLKCAELCLGERNLRCRSAEYHERDRVCRLSRQDRRTQPLSFRPSNPHVHYIENQCAGIPLQQNCEFEEFQEQDISHPDLQLSVESIEQCQEACEAEASMNCRSYTWVAQAGVCRLSGDDMTSAGLSAILPSPGVVYYQRTTCLDLRLSCTVDAMTVQLYTPEPFKGRLFSQDFPNTCKSQDKSRTETSLVINFRDPQCGTVDEGSGVYSNIIVVQHHPVIQRRGDKAIKLLCLFQAANQTVSDSFNFIVDSTFPGGRVATAIVNATAPSPRIRLRIVDREGNDINGARLGEELYLRLDLDDDSVYGILARNLVARSGDNSDSIVLLDDRGCPADPAIFPSLQPIPNSRSLQGKFEAFKFSEDQVVRFQVNVQFCLEECRPAQCGNIVSYGKRKRRSLKGEGGLVTLGGELTLIGGEVTLRDVEVLDNEEEEEEDHVYHEMPLQKEILVESTTVKPLKSGLLPEETEAHRIANLVCTSREVLIAMVVSAVILQICIILIAIMCVFARRRRKVPATEVQQGAPSLTLSRGYRSPYTVSYSEDSANTLKTLRTSLRD
ncbi:hypothetical protein O3P69_016373 [Scylla paramamosain]|uniref:Uncharacterized protein n=1 Tax=Scylla paramamosain TaxID=85552 RepID=A0AAW0TFG5_SCYPA